MLCAAEPQGSERAASLLVDIADAHQVDAIALVGNLSDGEGAGAYTSLLHALGRTGTPTFCVPGPDDAPIQGYLQNLRSIEAVHPTVHGIHGALAFAPGFVLFQGLGGEVSDEPDAPRFEEDRLSYPRWEAEYRLRLPAELTEHELVWLTWSEPLNKELTDEGSEVMAELISTARPRLVVCSGRPQTRLIGRSLVVSPGALREGHYAVADLHAQEAQLQRAFVPA